LKKKAALREEEKRKIVKIAEHSAVRVVWTDNPTRQLIAAKFLHDNTFNQSK
jgi:hypothetical protein